MSQTATATTLSRKQIRAVFNAHKGAAAQLARDLQLSHVAIANWLAGRIKSARVAAAAEKRAIELQNAPGAEQDDAA